MEWLKNFRISTFLVLSSIQNSMSRNYKWGTKKMIVLKVTSFLGIWTESMNFILEIENLNSKFLIFYNDILLTNFNQFSNLSEDLMEEMIKLSFDVFFYFLNRFFWKMENICFYILAHSNYKVKSYLNSFKTVSFNLIIK